MTRFAIFVAALSLSCGEAAPTWPAGANLTASIPDCAAADGSYMMTLRIPSANGVRGRGLDIYEITSSRDKPFTIVELFEEDDRPPERVLRLTVSGDQDIRVVAGDYRLRRTTPALLLHADAPMPLAEGERPRASATSLDPLGRCDVFPLPVDLDEATRQQLNAALLAPHISLRDYELSGEFSAKEHARSFAGLSLSMARDCADTIQGEALAVRVQVQLVEGSVKSKTVVTKAGGSVPEQIAACLLGSFERWDLPAVNGFADVKLDLVLTSD